MRKTALWLLLVLSWSCSRNLDLPPEPMMGPGTVVGRTVVAVPGRVERVSAKGVLVSLLSSTATSSSDDTGAFSLGGITTTEGAVLFRYDPDGNGTYDLQKLLGLQTLGAGPNQSVNIGDVLLAEPARVHGRALRGDRTDQRGGHAGTIIFVPQGPFTTYTGDDGAWSLEELPEGVVSISAFRAGYQSVSLSAVDARAGEDVSLRDMILLPEVGTPQPGGIAGQLEFMPAADAIGATMVALSLSDGAAFNGAVTDNGAFTVMPLPPDVYDVRVTRPDYSTTTAPNVVVASGQTTQLVITVGRGQSNDRPTPDGGTAPPDSGTPRPDGGLCATSLDCASNQWCDDGLCSPQCAVTAQCTNGRVCDTTTRTCVQPCGGGQCPTGQTCDSSTNLCRKICDGAFPCPATFVCNAVQLCVPECALPSDCAHPHQSCQAGACRFDGTCTFDVDCPMAELCVLNSCTTRPTAIADAGADGGVLYQCKAPCDCKMGEVCTSGVCLPDYVPTRFAAADGGGDGLSPATATSALPSLLMPDASVVVALRSGDLFSNADGGPIVIAAPNTALVGGYLACGANRWVRDVSTSSALTSSTGIVLNIHGTATRVYGDVALDGVDVVLAPAVCPSFFFTDLAYVDRLFVNRMKVSVAKPLPCNTAPSAVLNVASSQNVTLRDVSMVPSAETQGTGLTLALLNGSSGTLDHFTAPQQLISGLTLATVQMNTGPVTLKNFDTGPLTAHNSFPQPLVNLQQCAGVSLLSSHFTFMVNDPAGGGASELTTVKTLGCTSLVIDGNDFDGRTVLGLVPSSSTPVQVTSMWLEDSTGTVSNNTIDMPRPVNTNGGAHAGLYIKGPRGALDVGHNRITDPADQELFFGVRIEAVNQAGPLRIHDLVLDAGTNLQPSLGISALNVTGPAGLTITDVDLKPAASMSAAGSQGMQFVGSVVMIERARSVSPSSSSSGGLIFDSSQAEIYESFVSTGSSVNSTQYTGNYPSGLLVVTGSNVYAVGNTFELATDALMPGTAAALTCEGSQLFATANIFGGGAASTHIMARGTPGGCLVPQTFSSNYFWYSRPGPRTPSDNITAVTGSDGGVADARGNIVGENASPYGMTPQPTYVLSASSPCIDKGVGGGVRKDASAITTDLDGRPRKSGSEVDIGAYER